MTRFGRLTWLSVSQGARERIVWGVGFLFVSLLGLSVFLGAVSIGEQARVLRGAGLLAIEFSGLIVILLSFTFGFYRDRLSRMVEVYRTYVSYPRYTASKLCAAWILALGYVGLAGACWGVVLALHGAFAWPLLAGLVSLFLKLALAVAINFLCCCLFSSPALAVTASLFLYVAGALAPSAIEAMAQRLPDGPATLLFKGLACVLPDVSRLDATMTLLDGQLPGWGFFGVAAGYTLCYSLFLWSVGTWVSSRQE